MILRFPTYYLYLGVTIPKYCRTNRVSEAADLINGWAPLMYLGTLGQRVLDYSLYHSVFVNIGPRVSLLGQDPTCAPREVTVAVTFHAFLTFLFPTRGLGAPSSESL